MRPIATAMALAVSSSALLGAAGASDPVQGRVRVDIAAAPWQAIGQVNTAAYGRCSGILVAPHFALTASHCLISARTGRALPPSSIHLVLGYDRGAYTFATVAERIHREERQVIPQDIETLKDDWALLELAEPAPPSIAPIEVSPSVPTEGELFQAAGFGRDRAYSLTAVSSCSYRGGYADGLMLLDCPIVPGYSGGPLIDAQGRLAGVIVASTKNTTGQSAIALPPARWMDRLNRLEP